MLRYKAYLGRGSAICMLVRRVEEEERRLASLLETVRASQAFIWFLALQT